MQLAIRSCQVGGTKCVCEHSTLPSLLYLKVPPGNATWNYQCGTNTHMHNRSANSAADLPLFRHHVGAMLDICTVCVTFVCCLLIRQAGRHHSLGDC